MNMKSTLLLCLSVSGCIAVHPPKPPKLGLTLEAPAPPPSQAAVTSCEATRNSHNTWTLLGVIFGGVAGMSGVADAVTTNKDAQAGVGVGVAVSGIFAAVATTVASFEADAYSQGNCANILTQATGH
jgi:hypothetical protein